MAGQSRKVEVAVTCLDLSRPGQEIGDSLPRRLADRPEFEVLGSVIVSNPVQVVGGFSRQQESADLLLLGRVLEVARLTDGHPGRVSGGVLHAFSANPHNHTVTGGV